MFFRKLAQALSSSRTSKISRERGFTLIEVLGAIIVGAIIFAFAAFAIRNGIESAKVSNQNEALANLRVNIQEAFAPLHSYEELTNDAALSARIVPANMLAGANDDDAYGSSIINEWNGTIVLAADNENRDFTITLNAVPQGACIKLARNAKQWENMTVNDTAVERYGLQQVDEICTEEFENVIKYTSR